MSLIQTGDSLNRKVYQDDANFNLVVEAKKSIQPVRRRVNGQSVVEHVLVQEYVVRDTECLGQNACDPTKKLESQVVARLRISAPAGSTKVASVYATLLAAITGSGGVDKHTLSAVKSW